MEKATKENTLVIMAAEKGFPFDGYAAEGYHTVSAYKHTNILTRVLREICYRTPFLPKKCWYNPAVKQYDAKYIYIRDAIITREYLIWLQSIFPKAQINFSYENMIGKARHLKPEQIPEGIRVWTYDPYDSEQYGIRLKKVIPYFRCYLKQKRAQKYDLLFVGRDKGRGDRLKELEEYLNSRDIKTKFYITADGKLSRNKDYYEKPVSYDQITEWVAESGALLNIGMDQQKGVTIRDIESYFNQTKLVTTNENIKQSEIYDENNTFILKENNWDELVQFLKKDYISNHSVTWAGHQIEDAIREVTSQDP